MTCECDVEFPCASCRGEVHWIMPKGANMTDPMITAANTLEASPKPSYGPHKASERYLDTADHVELSDLEYDILRARMKPGEKGCATVSELLQALETLRTHLRRKYYGG